MSPQRNHAYRQTDTQTYPGCAGAPPQNQKLPNGTVIMPAIYETDRELATAGAAGVRGPTAARPIDGSGGDLSRGGSLSVTCSTMVSTSSDGKGTARVASRSKSLTVEGSWPVEEAMKVSGGVAAVVVAGVVC